VRGSQRWADVVGRRGGWVVLAAVLVVRHPSRRRLSAGPGAGIPAAPVPRYVRLLTPFFNITGTFALVLGALFSARVHAKRRVMRRVDRADGAAGMVRDLLTAVVALP
jgi:hypothetical protein